MDMPNGLSMVMVLQLLFASVAVVCLRDSADTCTGHAVEFKHRGQIEFGSSMSFRSAQAVDMDGDGDWEFVIERDGRLQYLKKDRNTGEFAEVGADRNPFAELPSFQGSFQVIDFNGDGFLDVVFSNWMISLGVHLSFFENAGNGSFVRSDYPLGQLVCAHGVWNTSNYRHLNCSQLSTPHVVDWNSDGHLDLIADDFEGHVFLFESISMGDARVLRHHPWRDLFSSSIVGFWPSAADVDGDGDLDLLVGLKKSIRYFERIADGGLLERIGADENPFHGIDPASRVQLLDWNGDGLLDILVERVAQQPQDISPFHAAVRQGTGGNVLFYYEQVVDHSLRRVVGDANPFAGVMPSAMPCLVDWDNDGDMDLFVGGGGNQENSPGGVAYYERSDDGYFKQHVGANHPLHFVTNDMSASYWPCAVDWNGDSKPDLIIGGGDGRVRYLQRVASGGLEELRDERNPFHEVNVSFAAAPQAVDWDGDGDLDLIVGACVAGGGSGPSGVLGTGLHYWENTNGSLQARSGNESPFGPPFSLGDWNQHLLGYHAADWDGDGDVDLALTTQTAKLMYFERMPDGGLLAYDAAKGGPFVGISGGGGSGSEAGTRIEVRPHILGLGGGNWTKSLLLGVDGGEAEYYAVGCVLKDSVACSGRGSCWSSQKCSCMAGHTLGDCSGCDQGFWHSRFTTHVAAPLCRPCPGMRRTTAGRHASCLGRGICSDGPLARAIRSIMPTDAGACGCNRACCHRRWSSDCVANECGSSWAEGFDMLGAPGTCSCSSPFSGPECGTGTCGTGAELRRVPDHELHLCQACNPGYSKYKEGTGRCALCSAGTFATQRGSENCTLCSPGRYQRQPGQTTCLLCPIGHYSHGGSSECIACPHQASSSNDRSSCLCPQGFYLKERLGLLDCQQCPDGRSTLFHGASSMSDCLGPSAIGIVSHVSGRDLVMKLSGAHPQPGHQLCPLTRCGVGDISGAISTDNGTDYVSVSAVLPGGVYRLCWCAHVTPVLCDKAAAYALDVGSVVVSGPVGTGDYKCTRSNRCMIAPIIGVALQSGDLVLPLLSCGSASWAPGLEVVLGTSLSKWNISFAADLGRLLDTGEPGKMSLCWCRPPCDGPSSFASSVGRLTLQGPHRGHDLSCFIGQPCSLAGIFGVSVLAGDRVAILTSCSSGDPPVGLPGLGVAEADAAGTEFSFLLGTEGENTTRVLGMLAGIYHLCFCRPANDSSCVQANDFSADAGLFQAVGPYMDNDATCLAGQQCTLTRLRGIGPVNSGELRLLHSCEESIMYDPERGLGSLGLPETVVSSVDGGASYNMGMLSDHAAPDTYSLCWRPAGHANAHFAALAGKFDVGCRPGYFKMHVKGGNYCSNCTPGFYCPGLGLKHRCPGGSTTEAAGSVSEDACVCGPGRYLDLLSAHCQLCVEGRYKPEASRADECSRHCPNSTTSLQGAQVIDDCFCMDGLQDADESLEGFNCVTTEPNKSGWSPSSSNTQARVFIFSWSCNLSLTEGSQLSLQDPALENRLIRAFADPLGLATNHISVQFHLLTQRNAGGRLLSSTGVAAMLHATFQTRAAYKDELHAVAESVDPNEVLTNLQDNYAIFSDIDQAGMPTLLAEVLLCNDYGLNRMFSAGSRPTMLEECKCQAGYEPIGQHTRDCRPCPAGRFKKNIGDEGCLACPAIPCSGCNMVEIALTTLFAGSKSSAECTCPAGYFAPSEPEAQMVCSPCGRNHFCSGGRTRERCPSGTWTANSKAGHVAECLCVNGSFREPGSDEAPTCLHPLEGMAWTCTAGCKCPLQTLHVLGVQNEDYVMLVNDGCSKETVEVANTSRSRPQRTTSSQQQTVHQQQADGRATTTSKLPARQPDDVTRCGFWLYVPVGQKTCSLDIHYMALLILCAAVHFSEAFVLMKTIRHRIRILDMSQSGSGLIVTSFGPHGVHVYSGSSTPVHVFGTDEPLLDGKCMRARVLDPLRLELLDEGGVPIHADATSSMGVIVQRFPWKLINVGLLVPRLVLSFVLLSTIWSIVLIWGLGGFFQERKEPALLRLTLFAMVSIATLLGVMTAAICQYMVYWQRTPLQQRIANFQRLLQQRRASPVACAPGPGRVVSLAQLTELLDVFRDLIGNRTTYYLDSNVTRPLTSDCKLSYAELVGPSELMTDTMFYVSHHWGMAFCDFVDAVRNHAQVSEDDHWQLAYWICFLSCNQWDLEAELGNDPCRALKSDTCKATCLVLDDQALALTRTWCLYEILETFKQDAEVGCSMSVHQRLILCSSKGTVEAGSCLGVAHATAQRLDTLSFVDAISTKPEDQTRIAEFVDYHGGADKAERVIRDGLGCILEHKYKNLFCLLQLPPPLLRRDASVSPLPDKTHVAPFMGARRLPPLSSHTPRGTAFSRPWLSLTDEGEDVESLYSL